MGFRFIPQQEIWMHETTIESLSFFLFFFYGCFFISMTSQWPRTLKKTQQLTSMYFSPSKNLIKLELPLLYDNICYCEKRQVVLHALFFHLFPICCITGKLLWAALACLNLSISGESLISATRLIQICFWRKAFFFFFRTGGWALEAAVVVEKIRGGTGGPI